MLISPVGKRSSFVFSETVNHLITRFCRSNNATPFSVFAMALFVYLSRMRSSGQTVLGVPVINRTTFKDKQTGGMFVSTLPFFINADPNSTLEEFNVSLTESWYDLLRHQKYPFSEILRDARTINPGTTGLFDIALSFQDSKIFRDRGASVIFTGKWVYSGYQTEKLIIHLSNFEDESHFSVDYDYLTQVYTGSDIAVMHSHICRILEETLSLPSVPLKKIQFLSSQEREQILYKFNSTSSEPPYSTVPEGFMRAVSSNPNKVALIYRGFRMTYTQLLEKVYSYAHAFSLAAPENNSVIAVCLPRGFELVVSMLASSFSRNAWLIIDPELPPERKKRIIADSDAALVLTSQKYSGFYIQAGANVLCFEDIEVIPSAHQTQTPSPNDLAYIVYTSGSTGVPKGVEIEHRSITNFAYAMADHYGHGGVLSLCSIGFDVFVLESIVSLLNAKTVVLADAANDPAELASLIRGFSAGFMAITPSRLQSYMLNIEFLRALSGVECIICGGEPLSGELIQQLRQVTCARIYNQYGPSETTVGVSCKLVSNTSIITAGAPMKNCKLYVLDEYLNALPIGAYGKLFISGMCVGRGYRNNPNATEQAFIPNPFELNETMYDSGDTACWTKDGEIIIGERIGSQVKLRGLRIELQEITSVLLTFPGIEQAAVKIIKNTSDYIAAYYTAKDEISQDDCAVFLSQQLPSYMIPSAWMRLEDMPLTANGKIDYKALPFPSQESGDRQPETDTERAVLDIFRHVLNNDTIGVDSDFYRCGGDSLNALIALNEIENRLGKTLKIPELFVLKTAARLAARLDGKSVSRDGALTISHAMRSEYPLTSIQQTMYFSTLLAKDMTLYNMPGAFRLGKGVDTARLTQALKTLTRQEDTLRTYFIPGTDSPVAKIADSAELHVDSIDAPDLAAALGKFVKPFDLSVPPLMRASFWNDGENNYLFVDIHHIINDGLGTQILLRKLNSIYGGKTEKPLRTYKDYACEITSRGKAAVDADMDYWKENLSGAETVCVLPSDRERTQLHKYEGSGFDTSLPAPLCAAIDAFCLENGTTPYSFFAGAFGILLSKLTGCASPVTGSPVSCREKADEYDMLGAFINTLPLRLDVKNELKPNEYIKHIAKTINDMIAHKDVSTGDIISAVGAQHVAGAGTLFNTLITFRPLSAEGFSLGGEKLEYIPAALNAAKLDLTLEVYGEKGNYSFRTEYATALFNETTIKFWSECYVHALSSLLMCETLSFFNSCFMPAEYTYRLFTKPDRQTAPFTDMLCDELADAVSYSFPELPAIIFRDKKISYTVFRKRAQAAANRIISLGVHKGSTVALAYARTDELICTLFGVLKAGCAYMMLTPSLPEARIDEMMKAASCSTILCDEKTLRALPGCEKYRTEILLTEADSAMQNAAHEIHRSSTDIAQVLFTSGSTGVPKGVMISHRAIASLTARLCEMYEKAGVHSVLFSSSVHFDSFTVEVLIPLACGRTVIIADEEQMMQPWMLSLLIDGADAPLMFSTPSRMQVFLNDKKFTRSLENVKMIMSGGEAVSASLAERMLSSCRGDIYNMYGPAETTAFVCAKLMKDAVKPTIGTPLPNVRIYILDKDHRRVMPTVPGEIYIAGVSLAEGYIGQPELTSASFMPDPFVPGERMYKTGDLARLLMNGELEFLGRADSQVKLNGQRIETGEITGIVLSNGFARDAAAAVVKAQSGGSLVLFIVPGDTPTDEETIKAAIGSGLPPYMIPSRIVTVDTIPYTVTGKADLRALTQSLEPSGHRETDEAPAAADNSSDVLTVLTDIWKTALGVDTPDADKSFFDQGGTSLAAMDTVIKYYAHGWSISLTEFYEHPTINGQSALIAASVQTAPVAQDEQDNASVLVTGATGYLGAHIVNELIAHGEKKIICLVRGGEERLWQTLEFYFGSEWTNANRQNVSILTGDITKPICVPDGTVLKRIIHAAADVRHYMPDA
ncbi:MAG TPA: amino acid adenylation domain-containing protein, partial [Bacillota bacterium]|nr:amino acid adenylation domain-containing protein [Bacillota bacterium]